jgi:hypothetical protein
MKNWEPVPLIMPTIDVPKGMNAFAFKTGAEKAWREKTQRHQLNVLIEQNNEIIRLLTSIAQRKD